MSHWENEPEHDEGLTEFEQMQLDQVILDTAYNNSYFVLTNQITFDDLLEKKFDKAKLKSIMEEAYPGISE